MSDSARAALEAEEDRRHLPASATKRGRARSASRLAAVSAEKEQAVAVFLAAVNEAMRHVKVRYPPPKKKIKINNNNNN